MNESKTRDGGERAAAARYARWSGVLLIALCVVSWAIVSARPGVSDEVLHEAVRWAESAPRTPCERPPLFGDALPGTGSLRTLVERGCTDARCSTLLHAVQHERVCAPERHQSSRWVDGILERLPASRSPSERLRLIMHAHRAMDDFRRGEQRAFPRPYDLRELASATQSVWRQARDLTDVDGLVAAAETLVATSPDATFLIGRNAGEVLWGFRRGEIAPGPNAPHPRATTVALAHLGQGIQRCELPCGEAWTWDECSRFACVSTYLSTRPNADPVSRWQALVRGPRAYGPSWIVGNTQFVGAQLNHHLRGFEQQRSLERLLLTALRLRELGECSTGIEQVVELGEVIARTSSSARLRMHAHDVPFEVHIETSNSALWIRDSVPDGPTLHVELCLEESVL